MSCRRWLFFSHHTWKYVSPIHRVCLVCGRMEQWLTIWTEYVGSITYWKNHVDEINKQVEEKVLEEKAKAEYLHSLVPEQSTAGESSNAKR